MTCSERIDCNPSVTRRLKSPPKPGQKSVLLADRFPVIPDNCEALPSSATPSSLPVTPEATGSSPVHAAIFPCSPQAQFARIKWTKKGIEERLAAEIPLRG